MLKHHKSHMNKIITIILMICISKIANAQLDPGAYWRGAEQARQQNWQDMRNAQQQQYMQQQLQRQQEASMIKNATRHNVDAVNVIANGMVVNDVVNLFGAYPFHRSTYNGYDVLQWCRTNAPGQVDDYALVFFQDGKVARAEKTRHMADIDCRDTPVAFR